MIDKTHQARQGVFVQSQRVLILRIHKRSVALTSLHLTLTEDSRDLTCNTCRCISLNRPLHTAMPTPNVSAYHMVTTLKPPCELRDRSNSQNITSHTGLVIQQQTLPIQRLAGTPPRMGGPSITATLLSRCQLAKTSYSAPHRLITDNILFC